MAATAYTTRGAAPTLAYTLLVLESPLVARKHRIDDSAASLPQLVSAVQAALGQRQRADCCLESVHPDSTVKRVEELQQLHDAGRASSASKYSSALEHTRRCVSAGWDDGDFDRSAGANHVPVQSDRHVVRTAECRHVRSVVPNGRVRNSLDGDSNELGVH
jgi:hypothetical protein